VAVLLASGFFQRYLIRLVPFMEFRLLIAADKLVKLIESLRVFLGESRRESIRAIHYKASDFSNEIF